MHEISQRAPEAADTDASSVTRKRVLFIAEAVTLAHVARVHALAQMLDREVFEICIACDPRYNALIGNHPFESRAITTISRERFTAALEKGRPLYDVPTLTAYVEEDGSIIDAFRPDVVIGDFRLSLSISARLARVPYVNITNAGWSPYARLKFTIPDIALARLLGVPVAQALFDIARPFAFALHAMPLNRLRKRYGLRSLPLDLRYIYTDGDFTLYADIPELFTVDSLPSNHAFLGAVLWSPAMPLPSWWNALPYDSPIVYVTLGSSGQIALLPTVLEILGELPVTVIAATAGRIALDRIPPNAHVADYLPGSLAAAVASVVICNGGSPTCYQAFSAGVPVIGIAGNLDQYLNMRAVENNNAGVLIRPQELRFKLAASIDAALTSDTQSRSAQRLGMAIENHQPSSVLNKTLSRAMGIESIRE